MKADPETEAASMAVIKQWFEAFTKRDINGVIALFLPEPDVVAIGTGRDEKCIGPNEIRSIIERAFSQFKDASVKFVWHSVSAVGSIAFLAADVVLDIKANERQTSEHLRLTTVLEKRENRWLIAQWHSSVPDSGQKEGQAFAA